MGTGRPKPKDFETRVRVYRSLGDVIDQNDEALAAFVERLPPEDRFELLRSAVPELKARLAPALAPVSDLPIRPALRPARIPADLPPDLRERLLAYRDRIQSRYDRLLKNGHERSNVYVSRTLSGPVRLASYASAHLGLTRWDALRTRDVVAFMAAHPGVSRQHVEPFLRFLTENQPFRQARRGSRPKHRGEKRNALAPEVVEAAELDALLAEVRASRSDAEYILAWLVCRMGVRVHMAHALTLDRVRVNDAGQLVVRPAKVWVAVPGRESATIRRMLESVVPGWERKPPEELRFLRLFDPHVVRLPVFIAEVLQGRARRLRLSAIYAAMRKGHLDRVTLTKTLGVSAPTLVRLEQLLTADLHGRLSPGLVKARNRVIRGEVDG